MEHRLFHLPGHSVSQVDGYGQFSFGFDDLGLVDKTIEDSFIDSVVLQRTPTWVAKQTLLLVHHQPTNMDC